MVYTSRTPAKYVIKVCGMGRMGTNMGGGEGWEVSKAALWGRKKVTVSRVDEKGGTNTGQHNGTAGECRGYRGRAKHGSYEGMDKNRTTQ